ncbi:hypothetical protein [Jatrophihabitans endophyticus]|uniref:hypothetical protein n=1 Tax=Jatrophihabitans endophyticus TaxID=1206085 RepID=UPI001A05958D|nr:hypothetical protein [Jatrophihabitans endophyticus]MBE7190021.1 hypothetical protein [Jatrophihabitans endophyticus]
MTAPAVPLRPLGVAEVLDGAVRLVRRNPRAAFGFALPVAVVQAALVAVVLTTTYSAPALSTVSELLRLLVSLSAGTVLAGLFAPVVVSDVLGRPIPAGEAWRRSRGARGVLLLVVLGVVVALAETLGLVLALVGGIWLWGAWAVAGPALTVEGLGPVAAVRRSFRLTSPRFWRVWGVRALGSVVTEVLGLLVTLPFSALAAYVGSVGFGQSTGDITHPALFVTLTALGQLLAVALVAPIGASIDGLIYVDLRMRVEGLDLVVAAPSSPPSPAPAPMPVSAW